jgi:hypothetical protein
VAVRKAKRKNLVGRKVKRKRIGRGHDQTSHEDSGSTHYLSW